MRSWTAPDGKTYPVSDAHAAMIDAGMGRDWLIPDAADAERKRLAALSQTRKNLHAYPVITTKERAMITACDAVVNMWNAVKFLQGRDHTELFEHIDQVHGQHVSHSCGCMLREIFDHHLRHIPDKPNHPHTPIFVCDKHVHMKADLPALHAAARSGK